MGSQDITKDLLITNTAMQFESVVAEMLEQWQNIV